MADTINSRSLKPLRLCFCQGVCFCFLPLRRTVCQIVQSEDLAAAAECGERDLLGFSGLEAHGGSGGNVEMHAERCRAVEIERLVRFEEVKMAAHLDRTVPGVPRFAWDFSATAAAF